MMLLSRLLLFNGLFLAGILPLVAAETVDNASPQKQKKLTLAPTSHIYTPYLADQRRVTFGFQLLYFTHSEILSTSHKRFSLRIGGRLELFNWRNQAKPQERLQANLEVGYRGQFDASHSWDNTGWDGNYGLLFSYRNSDILAYRFGIYHTSSHIGDEYVERTGRLRINYTREEILAGMQLDLHPRWQTYLEAGYDYEAEERPLQDHMRAQIGLQYQQSHFSAKERLGWYAGIDLSSYEERDWSINKALQIGFAFDAPPMSGESPWIIIMANLRWVNFSRKMKNMQALAFISTFKPMPVRYRMTAYVARKVCNPEYRNP